MNTISRFFRNTMISLLLLIAFGCGTTSDLPTQLAPIFTENMVLQRDQEIPIWGTASPNTLISIQFRDQQKEVKADEQGKWMLKLDAENFGGPNQLIIQSDKDSLQIENVFVGEVWICSGQSNMEMPLISNWAHVNNAEEEVKQANFLNIHLFKVERNIAFHPTTEMKSNGWVTCTPENIADFSAVAYFFGKDLFSTLNMPIGLIQTAWGGTVAEAWTSGRTLKNMPDFKENVLKLEATSATPEELQEQYENDILKLNEEIAIADIGINGKDTIFPKENLDDSEWQTMDLPGMWESTPLGVFDGAVWFRKTIKLPATCINKPMTLHIGAPDDTDEAWFNGVKVGESTEWDVPRQYPIPANLIKSGNNVITLRVADFRGSGGFMGEASHFALTDEEGFRMELADNWKCKVGFDLKETKTTPIKPDEPNHPTVLYNAMITPLIPYAFRGVIWYQGESNVGRAKQYTELFPALIQDWQKSWEKDQFPFLFVQLASYLKRNEQPVEDPWADLREAQRSTLKLPMTGMAVAIDIGDANDIHPGNKQDVGKRLALLARNKVYDEDIPCSGPLYKSMKIINSTIEIEFDYCYDGLKSSDNRPITGFSIAGDDGKFYWATATVNNDKLIIQSQKIAQPVTVRYAWSANPDCNLVNTAGLPASPFSTQTKP